MLLFKNLHFLTIALLLTLTACGGGGGGGDDDDDAVPTPVFKTFQPDDVVIGQPDFGSASANQGGATGANTLKFVHGAPAQGSLYLPDINNHRILGFNSIPATSNASADFVLGQTAFTGNAAGTTANSFTGPFDVVTADGKLFVVDTFNHRVLIWNTLPTSNNVPADVVVGANSFTDSTPGTSKTELNVPTGIAVAGGKMFVVEQNNHRVLIWNSIPTGNNAPADVVIGQPDFTSSTPGLSATKIENPLGGIWSDGQRLAVTDSFNNRVLVWNTIPTTNGVAADLVIGQPDFVTGTA
jgi:hypothetical protein